MVTVVMYHYVREIKNSRYPNIKGLEAENFKRQLEYLDSCYSFITMAELIAFLEGDFKLPENSLLLTFDDGYSDHFNFVYPVLKNMGIQGSFFIPVGPILESKVLDVNKIHFLLASTDTRTLMDSIKDILLGLRNEPGILGFEEYYDELAKPNRFDPADVIFIKRLLQHKLPDPYRSEVTNHLFKQNFHTTETILAEELYLSMDQCTCMLKDGMHIGAHTYDHYWLNRISDKEQSRQMNLNIEFLNGLSSDQQERTMAYPFGGYNTTTLKLMEELNFRAGFTTRVDAIDHKDQYSTFELPRLDTNDLPIHL